MAPRATIELSLTGTLFEWYGPSPHHFVAVTGEEATELHAISPIVSYGWGMIPVEATIGGTTWTTSLFPKEDRYLLPVKAAVRQREQLSVGDMVTTTLFFTLDRGRTERPVRYEERVVGSARTMIVPSNESPSRQRSR